MQCWTNVQDVAPTLYKCNTDVVCLLGCLMFTIYCAHAHGPCTRTRTHIMCKWMAFLRRKHHENVYTRQTREGEQVVDQLYNQLQLVLYNRVIRLHVVTVYCVCILYSICELDVIKWNYFLVSVIPMASIIIKQVDLYGCLTDMDGVRKTY